MADQFSVKSHVGRKKSFACQLCGYEPVTQNKYRERADHLYHVHFKGEIDSLLPRSRPYLCPTQGCSFTGNDLQGLQRHLLGKHGVLAMLLKEALEARGITQRMSKLNKKKLENLPRVRPSQHHVFQPQTVDFTSRPGAAATDATSGHHPSPTMTRGKADEGVNFGATAKRARSDDIATPQSAGAGMTTLAGFPLLSYLPAKERRCQSPERISLDPWLSTLRNPWEFWPFPSTSTNKKMSISIGQPLFIPPLWFPSGEKKLCGETRLNGEKRRSGETHGLNASKTHCSTTSTSKVTPKSCANASTTCRTHTGTTHMSTSSTNSRTQSSRKTELTAGNPNICEQQSFQQLIPKLADNGTFSSRSQCAQTTELPAADSKVLGQKSLQQPIPILPDNGTFSSRSQCTRTTELPVSDSKVPGQQRLQHPIPILPDKKTSSSKAQFSRTTELPAVGSKVPGQKSLRQPVPILPDNGTSSSRSQYARTTELPAADSKVLGQKSLQQPIPILPDNGTSSSKSQCARTTELPAADSKVLGQQIFQQPIPILLDYGTSSSKSQCARKTERPAADSKVPGQKRLQQPIPILPDNGISSSRSQCTRTMELPAVYPYVPGQQSFLQPQLWSNLLLLSLQRK